MDMFTSYGHIKKRELKYRFFMILAWLCGFKELKWEDKQSLSTWLCEV